MFFQNGNANFFSRAWVNSGFVDDNSTALHVFADRFARANEGSEIGIVGDIHRRRHGNNDVVSRSQGRRIGADRQLTRCLEVCA